MKTCGLVWTSVCGFGKRVGLTALAGSNPASSAPLSQGTRRPELTGQGGGFAAIVSVLVSVASVQFRFMLDSQLLSAGDHRSPPIRLATSCRMGLVTCW